MSRDQVLAAVVGLAATAGFWLWGHRSTPGVTVGPPMVAPLQQIARPAGGSITRLRTRMVSSERLAVWGSTDAPDGSSIRLRMVGADVPAVELAVPAVAGRFSATLAVPPATRSRTFRVTAAVSR